MTARTGIQPGEAACWGEKVPGFEALQVVLALRLISCVGHFFSLGLSFPSIKQELNHIEAA